MDSFQISEHGRVNQQKETAAIYAIVSRNLQPENWVELIPEARIQMFLEVSALLRSENLSAQHKQELVAFVERYMPTCEIRSELLEKWSKKYAVAQ